MGSIPISLSEFRGFVFNDLDGYYSEETVGNERAFDRNIGKGYTVRILTSIPADGDIVRREGDAIRVLLLDPDNKPLVYTSHVKRTPGYRDRIQDRLDELIGCDSCGDRMAASVSDYGPYLFCTSDECSTTRNLDEN
jgi:hypothetical protein